MRHYQKQGYFVVRSAGSHGIADLVVIGPQVESFEFAKKTSPTVILVQCKTGKSFRLEHKRRLETFAASLGVQAVWAQRQNRKATLEWLSVEPKVKETL
jgi:hypothetical protein